MTDTIETLRAELAAITARVAAFEEARTGEEEPPVCSEELLAHLERGCDYLAASDYKKAAAEIRYLRSELARLREGLEVQVGDVGEDRLALWVTDEDSLWIGDMAREIQRHRALLKDGGGK